jgi:hypothetical protein
MSIDLARSVSRGRRAVLAGGVLLLLMGAVAGSLAACNGRAAGSSSVVHGDPGDGCQSGADCRSGRCQEGVCLAGNVPAGGACVAYSDCASGRCDQGICVDPGSGVGPGPGPGPGGPDGGGGGGMRDVVVVEDQPVPTDLPMSFDVPITMTPDDGIVGTRDVVITQDRPLPDDGGTAARPTITMLSPMDGDVIEVDPDTLEIPITFTTTGYDLRTIDGAGACPASEDWCGFAQVFLDGTQCNYIHQSNNTAGSSPTAALLAPCHRTEGTHTLQLELSPNGQMGYSPPIRSRSITVTVTCPPGSNC